MKRVDRGFCCESGDGYSSSDGEGEWGWVLSDGEEKSCVVVRMME